MFKSAIIGIFISSLSLSPLTLYAANSNVNCDTISNPTAKGLCHKIKADAIESGKTYSQFSAHLKANPSVKKTYLESYKHYALTTQKNVATADGVSISDTSSTQHMRMCQGLCAGAQVAEAIPVIGWIIAAALIVAAIAEKCDNCGGESAW